jgi:hypothetical protein
LFGLVGAEESRSHLEGLKGDESQVEIYKDHGLVEYRVKDLAEEALKRLDAGG